MKNFEFHVLKFQDIFKVCFFQPWGLQMVKAQLQSLELADAYKKRFMPQNGQVAVLKCSPTWKKMRKSFKTLSELKLELIPKACKREAMAHIIRPPPPPPPRP